MLGMEKVKFKIDSNTKHIFAMFAFKQMLVRDFLSSVFPF